MLTALRKTYSHTEMTIIMTSAHFDPQQRKQLLALGADVCLGKPYTPAALHAALQEVALQNKDENAVLNISADMFKHIQEHLGDEKTRKVIALYERQLREDLACILHATEIQDAAGLRVAAHRIAGASLMLGFHHHAAAASQLETFEEDQQEVNWENFQALITHNTAILQS
ncbi:MAG: Hpt domain-containing protein [Thiolinea sp.]